MSWIKSSSPRLFSPLENIQKKKSAKKKAASKRSAAKKSVAKKTATASVKVKEPESSSFDKKSAFRTDGFETTISAHNAPVVNLYARLGFRFTRPQATFHWRRT